MSSDPAAIPHTGHELHPIRDQWWCILIMGIALVVAGAACISVPFLAGVGAVVFLGFMLVAAGITQVVSSFWAGKWSGMMLHMLIGIMYAVVGFMLIDAPANNLILLTKMCAIFLIVTGIFNIVAALSHRFHRWGWVLLNGAVTLMLGLLINRGWPESSVWVIGTFVGVEMIFNGWAWIMLSIGLKSAPKLA